MLKWLKRVLVAVASLALLTVVAGPWGLYWLGLEGVEGKPAQSVTMASSEKMQEVWVLARGSGVPNIPEMSPYSVVYDFLFYKEVDRRKEAGKKLAYWVASRYVYTHQKKKGALWWQLSWSSMSIWLTRHWTQEQIFSKAVEMGFAEAVERDAKAREAKRLQSEE